MAITEHDLDEALIRIGEAIDRYRHTGPQVQLRDDSGPAAPRRIVRGVRRGLVVAVAASLVAVVGGWSLTLLVRDGRDDRGDAPSGPVDSRDGSPNVPVSAEPGVLSPVIEPLLPPGFVVVRETTSAPLVVTALGPDGVVLNVRVGLDEAATVRQQVGDTLVSTPAGEATSNGSTVFTAAGDVVSVDTWYGSQPPAEVPAAAFAAVPDEEIARLATGVATAIDDDLRSELGAVASNVNDLATADLRGDVQAALVESAGGTLSTWGGADPGHFRVSVVTPASTDLTLTAIRSTTPVEEGTVRPTPTAVTVTEYVDGWIVQLVDIDTTAPAGVLGDEDLAEMLEAIVPIFEEWTNEIPTSSPCGTYTIRAGDSLGSIAEEHGVTLEALDAANADLETAGLPGSSINLPCPDSNGTPPAAGPVTEPTATAAANDDLPYLVIDPTPAGFTFSDAISGGYGKDYEPPALLLAWHDGNAAAPITVGRVNEPPSMEAPVDADLVAGDALTGWIWHTDGITSAYLQPSEGPGYRLYSATADIPGTVVIDVVAALDPDGSLAWQTAVPDDITEIARQDADATVHAVSYDSPDGVITVSTYNDLPINGLTLDPGTTITPGLSVLGMNAFALSSDPGDGGTDPTVYWLSDPGVVHSISAAGTNIGLDELISIAEQTRVATRDEEATYER